MNTKLTHWQRLLSLLFLCFSVGLRPAQAQMKVGQPAGSPDPSAALDVSGGPYSSGSQYRGIAPPKVALTQTSTAVPVTSPATGLLVYNTAKAGDVTPGYYYWEGTKWLRFTTASAGAARVAAVNGQSIPAYLISQVASLSAPDIVYIADPGREGMFRYVANSSETADNAMVLAASGGRYKRIITDGRITPQMFGAIANDGNDDGVSLQAWLSAGKGYELYLPSGEYISGVNLTRNNMGSLRLRGAGRTVTVISFTGDADGLSITNGSSGPTNGEIHIEGITLRSGGNKSSGSLGRTALYINGQSSHQPGVTLEDINITVNDADSEWTTGIHILNCMSSTIKRITIFGATLNKLTGIVYDNTSGNPAVNTNFSDLNFQLMKKGVQIDGWGGAPAVEGISFSQVKLVGVMQGITAVSHSYGAPLIDFIGVHIDSRQEAVILDKFEQVNFGANCLFYQRYDSNENITQPIAAVRLEQPKAISGALTIWTAGPLQYAVDLTGNGLGVIMDVQHFASFGHTTSVHNAPNVSEVECTIHRYLITTDAINNNTGHHYFDENSRGIWHGTYESDREVITQQFDPQGHLDAASYAITPKLIQVTTVQTGNSILNDITYHHVGQTLTIIFDASATIHHQAGRLFLVDQRDKVMPVKSRITFVRTSLQWEEISSTFMPGVVQGDTPISRAKRITDPDTDLPSGFYTVEGGNNHTPPGGANDFWYLTVNHHQNNTPSPGPYRWDIIYKLGSGEMYEREVSNGTYGSWFKMHSSRWFKVDNTMTPAINDVLSYNGTKWTQKPGSSFMAASGGKLMPANTASFTSTLGWSVTNYTQVIAPATLTDATIYLVKAVYSKSGLDVVVQSWLVPISTTYPNSGTPTDLIGNSSIYGGNSGRYIKLRQKRGPVSNTTFGLEAALSNADMVANDASVVITVTPLF